MKKSTLVKKAIPDILSGRVNFSCTALTKVSFDAGKYHAEIAEIRADISRLIAPNTTLEYYLADKFLGGNGCMLRGTPDRKRFMRMLRVKFMEMLIAKYKLSGD